MRVRVRADALTVFVDILELTLWVMLYSDLFLGALHKVASLFEN